MDTKRFSTLLSVTAADDAVLAVVVFGSYNRGEPYNDVDVALVLDPRVNVNLVDVMKRYNPFLDEFDLHVFQDLPLYVRASVMKEGTILQEKDKDTLFDVFWNTIKDWNLFRPHYETFLDAVKDG